MGLHLAEDKQMTMGVCFAGMSSGAGVPLLQ